jgi:hypothetical protein
MEDVSKLVIDIEARLTNLEKNLKSAEKMGVDSVGRMEQIFQKAQMRFNDSLAKKSISEIEQQVVKLRAALEKRMEMGAPLGQLEILKTSLNKAENAAAQFKKKAEEPVSGTGMFGDFGTKIKAMATQLLGVLATMLAFQKVKQFIGDAMGAFEGRQESLLGVDSIIKSMGKDSEFTSDGLLQMSKQLSSFNKYRFKVGEILDLQGFLLTLDTMTKDLMPRASQVVMDLAAKMKTGLVEAAKAVGIALEDPEGGLNRFRRSGIIFTVAQKEVIKSLVEAGDKAGAQAKIFELLENKVGGYARNTTTNYGLLKNGLSVAFGAMERTIGGFLVNAVGPLFQSLTALVPKDTYEEFNKLSVAIKNTNNAIIPAIASYENLKAKGTLNKEESEKLKTAIEQIAAAFPEAITEWDKYGNAIDISTGKLKDLIEQQKIAGQTLKDLSLQEVYNEYGKLQQQIEANKFKMTQKTYTTGESDAPMEYTKTDYSRMQEENQAYGKQMKELEERRNVLLGRETKGSTITPGKTDPTKTQMEILQQNLEATKTLLAARQKLQEEAITSEYLREKTRIDNTYKLALVDIENKKKLATKEKPVSDAALNKEKEAAKIVHDADMLKLDRETDARKIKETEELLKTIWAMEGKYAGELKDLERQKYEAQIKDYSLTVDDYSKHLDRLRDLDIKAMERKNLDIRKYNMQNIPYFMLKMAFPLQEIDIADYSTGKSKDNASATDTYSNGKKDKDLKEWEKDNKIFAEAAKHGITSITSEWSSALSEWITKGKTFADATTHMWTNMANSIIDQLIKIGVQFALLSAAEGLFGAGTGGFGGFLIKALGGHTGGTFSKDGVQRMSGGGTARVPMGYRDDSYLVAVESDEDLHVTPAGQTRSNDIEQAAISRKLSVLNANIVDGNNKQKKQGPVEVIGKIGNDAVYLSSDRGGKIYRSQR